jgi:uncharacterized protein (TIGR02453 family)
MEQRHPAADRPAPAAAADVAAEPAGAISIERVTMPSKPPVFSKNIVRFLRDLDYNNSKIWMDANRERYRADLVEPFRALLECFTPSVLKLNKGFVCSGRVGVNFSRINRDIRFAKDKTPYRPHMYLFFAEGDGEGGQLYVGASTEGVTCGFRIYGGGRESALVKFGRPRGATQSAWIERQERKLGRKYESYWYSTEKGEWTKHRGWPAAPENWKRLQGWIVRRKFSPGAAAGASFEREVCNIFKETYPLWAFAGTAKWKA